MKLRIAKKILKHQEPIGRWWITRERPGFYGNYSGHQKQLASHRVFRYASHNELGQLALAALYLKHPETFQVDDQMDLKFERLIGQNMRGEKLIISNKFFTPPPEDRSKPVYNGMGQIHNFNAKKFGRNDKVAYKSVPGVNEESVHNFVNVAVITKGRKRDRGESTFLRYQARDNNTRKVPKYHV
jgi:hypothetical protein